MYLFFNISITINYLFVTLSTICWNSIHVSLIKYLRDPAKKKNVTNFSCQHASRFIIRQTVSYSLPLRWWFIVCHLVASLTHTHKQTTMIVSHELNDGSRKITDCLYARNSLSLFLYMYDHH